MAGFGGIAYGGAPFGGGNAGRTASDSFTISDVVVAYSSHPRGPSDGWAVSDALVARSQYQRTVSDSFSVGDSVARSTHFARSASDGWAVGGDVADAKFIPYIDEPTPLFLARGLAPMVLDPAVADQTLDAALFTLRLEEQRTGQDIGPHIARLALENVPVGLWTDG